MLFGIQKIFAVFAAVIILLIAGLFLYLSSLEGKRAEELEIAGQKIKQPLYFAHRGGAQEAPENTMEAFEKAAANGIDILELDVRMTRDGRLVVIHDSEIDRTTDGKGPVSGFSLSELQRFDAGHKFTKNGGKEFPFRGKGIKIPTLAEVLDKFRDRGINIEIKEADPGATGKLCALITESQRRDTVIVASADSAVLARFRTECDGVATSAGFGETLWFLFLYKTGFSNRFNAEMQALQVPERLFGTDVATKDFIAAARERNLKIHIWTANKKSDIKRLLDAGVDGVMTDRPSLIQEFPK